LANIANQIGGWGYLVGFLVFVSLTLFLVLKIVFSEAELLDPATLTSLLDFFTIAVAVVIVAVPEGLPLSITIAMAFSIDKLKKDNLLVKRMAACENMGGITEIATGKTATLTKNDLSVAAFYTAREFYPNRDKNTFSTIPINNHVRQLIQDCIVYNNEAKIEMSDDAMYIPTGNGIEVGMLNFLADNEISIYDLYIHKQKVNIMETNIPFGPIRKRQTIAIRPSLSHDFVRVVVKGAPEYIMPMCTSQIN
jgi:Ca2+ transporting ATPase